MPLEAVLLVLASTVIHAGWNARLHRMDDPAVVVATSYLWVGVVLLPMMVVDPPVEVLGWVFASAAAQAVYIGCLGAAYRDGSLSVAYPIARGTAPLLIGLGGWWLLGETPSTATSVGLVVLTAGILLVAGLGARLREGRAVGLALLTGCGTVAYSLIDARSVDLTGTLGYLSVIMILSSLVVFAVRRPGAERMRASLRPGALIGAGQGTAYALVVRAFQQAQTGQVAGLRQVSVVLGVLLAREALGTRALAGALVVTVGAVLVVW